ncbi:hypothetical protein CcCBS67573_g08561 [Chytriomyces confervae]|uniref:Uncharacterized protein n=1 Tax=Chytriomyces confervae TaxID=246404 RepID=A0A507EKY7_9FUNG|nr:hypothetical protein CcCBS67573_g08561 [Chytriomyces confervae]
MGQIRTLFVSSVAINWDKSARNVRLNHYFIINSCKLQ